MEAGPKTFDAQHVDAFDDGEEFTLVDPDGTPRKFNAKGHTKRLPIIDDTEKEIAGPRVGKKELYSSHFRKQLLSRAKEDMTPGGHKGLKANRKRTNPNGTGNNLVDIYWDKYDSQKKTGMISENYKRKNKKKITPESSMELLLEFTIGSEDYFSADGMQFERKKKNTDKVYKLYRKENEILIHNGVKLLGEADDDLEYFSQIDYLQKLGILTNKTPFKFNEDLSEIKLFKLILKKTKRSKKIMLDIILNISTGVISFDDAELSNEDFKKWYNKWLEDKDSPPNILDFWTTYPLAKTLESMTVEPIKDIQIGGFVYSDVEYEYSSSIDDYSICSSDEE